MTVALIVVDRVRKFMGYGAAGFQAIRNRQTIAPKSVRRERRKSHLTYLHVTAPSLFASLRNIGAHGHSTELITLQNVLDF